MLSAQGHGPRGEKRHQLDAKGAAGLDPAERERRRGGERENEEKTDRARRAGSQACSLFTKPVKNLQILALLALVPTFILGAATPADDFYLVRLQAGKAEAAAGRPYEAIDDLKIASFGFLDQPVLLVEGLSRLALAQAAAGRNEDAEATLRRMVEIEKRYHGWAEADLEPETRAAVVALVGKRLGADAAKLLVAPPVPAASAHGRSRLRFRPPSRRLRSSGAARAGHRAALTSGDDGHPRRVEVPGDPGALRGEPQEARGGRGGQPDGPGAAEGAARGSLPDEGLGDGGGPAGADPAVPGWGGALDVLRRGRAA